MENSVKSSNPELIEQLKSLYNELSRDNLNRLTEIYDRQIRFLDPLHEVNGLDALQEYFSGMYQRLQQSRFEYHDVIAADGKAFLKWRMFYQHPAINNGKEVSFDGVTELHYNGKITYHRDYYDAGAMLYEHLPVLGWSIRALKRRMQN